jgi:predicted dinucleotide-binding enzyme
VLIAGDHEGAKAKGAALAGGGGLNPIDVGPIKRARELEAAGLLHMGVRNELRTCFAGAHEVVA